MIDGSVVSRFRLAFVARAMRRSRPTHQWRATLGQARQQEQRPRTLISMDLRHQNVIVVDDHQGIIS